MFPFFVSKANEFNTKGSFQSDDLENCDLSEIAKEVAEEVNLSRNEIVFVKSDKKCLGKWNRNGLRKVLENLVNNAIKYGATRNFC
jgi:signal transduction histidine kinase